MTTTPNDVTCRNGRHPWPDSMYVKPNGKTYCRECNSHGRRPGLVLSTVPLMPNLTGAVCAQHPGLPWVPDVGTSQKTIQQLRDLCRGCPVIEACRDYALSDRELHGVWGGMSWRERRAVWEGR